jgi:hypothetical protein
VVAAHLVVDTGWVDVALAAVVEAGLVVVVVALPDLTLDVVVMVIVMEVVAAAAVVVVVGVVVVWMAGVPVIFTRIMRDLIKVMGMVVVEVEVVVVVVVVDSRVMVVLPNRVSRLWSAM